jgi:hypothetical protein
MKKAEKWFGHKPPLVLAHLCPPLIEHPKKKICKNVDIQFTGRKKTK